MISVARSTDDPGVVPEVQVVSPRPASALVHGTRLAGGLRTDVDLMAPDRWCGVSYPASYVPAGPLLGILIGDEAAEASRSPGETYLPSIKRRPPVDLTHAGAWLRVAVVDALGRWLQAPLDQSLLEAERGVARGRAARTLPHGPARAVITGDAVRLARRASCDLKTFLRRLSRHSQPIPQGLLLAVKQLVDGYDELREEVSGPDRELTSVVEAWRRLSRRAEVAEHGTAEHSVPDGSPTAEPQARPSCPAATSAVDPRQLTARTVALSDDPALLEVTVSAPAAEDPDRVRVRVPAFGRTVDEDAAARLLVRLVDRRSGEAHGHAVLGMGRTYDGGLFFEATVPLCGLHPSDVRADVFDALSGLSPACDDTDGVVQEARRAVVFLAEWRRLVGLAQLGAATATPALRLRDLATRLQPGRVRTDTALFTGGPSRAELEALADLGDDGLSACLRGEGALGEGLRALTVGPAALLVAELAAFVLGPAV